MTNAKAPHGNQMNCGDNFAIPKSKTAYSVNDINYTDTFYKNECSIHARTIRYNQLILE